MDRQVSALAQEARLTALQNVVSSVYVAPQEEGGVDGEQNNHDSSRVARPDEQQAQEESGTTMDQTVVTTPPAAEKQQRQQSSTQEDGTTKSGESTLGCDEKRSVRPAARETTSELLPSPPVLEAGLHHREPGAYRFSTSRPPRRVGHQSSSHSLDDNASAYNSSESLPMTESKRQGTVLLEATLVQGSNRGNHETTTLQAEISEPNTSPIHVLSTKVVDAREVNVERDDVVGIRKRSLVIAGILAMILLVGVGVVVGVVVGGGGGGDNEPEALTPPTPAPSPVTNPVIESFRTILPAGTLTSLEDPESPQSSALSWLAANENLDRYDTLRLVQRYVLATLFFSTNGPEWSDNDGWLSDDDECDWSMDEFSLCSGLVLQYFTLIERGLAGTLPPEIGMLTLLVGLDLSVNQLGGRIPIEIALLSNLEELWLLDNGFVGRIPTEFGTMSQLLFLGLTSNVLSDTIPTELARLTFLTELWLSDNFLTGTFPEWLSDLSILGALLLSENLIRGPIPAALENLSELRELELQALSLTGIFPMNLWGAFTELEYLLISDTDLQGSIDPGIGQLTSVDVLELYINDFDGQIPTEMGLMENAAYIDLADNWLTGEIPSELALLENLETLYLYDNLLTGSVPPQLCARVTDDGLDLAVDCESVMCSCECNCLLSTV